jgi:hypothetical protein
MKQLIWICAAGALALAACKKSEDGKGAAAGGAEAACSAAIAKGLEGLGARGEATGVKEKLQGIYTKRCTEDKWSADVLACFESAAGMAAMKACRGKLPPEQSAKLQSDIMTVMAGAGAMMGGAPMGHPGGPMGPGAMGGAMGGAGAPAGDPGAAAPGAAAPAGTAAPSAGTAAPSGSAK